MKNITILINVLILFLCWQSSAWAVKECISCHDQVQFQGKTVHKPVALNQCTACHNPHVAKYKGLLQKQGGALCYSCHKEAETRFSQGTQHQPVQEGQCLICHDAHASSQKSLLSKPVAETCFGCHEALAQKEFPVKHKPFAQGRCTTCHTPHNADNDQLLKRNNDDLCLGCHAQPEKLASHAGFPGKSGQCLSCHNPHGSTSKGLIRTNIHAPFKQGCTSCHSDQKRLNTELCLSCHQDVKEQMLAPHSHMLAGEQGCIVCHSPHASDIPGLLNAPYKQLCKSCHMDTFDRNRQSLHPHPETKKCTDCHAPHGSKRLVMHNADGNTLCSRCHASQGEFSHAVGSGVIDHRTGQGMTCLSCHDPMGSEYRYNLKLSGKKALCLQCHRAY